MREVEVTREWREPEDGGKQWKEKQRYKNILEKKQPGIVFILDESATQEALCPLFLLSRKRRVMVVQHVFQCFQFHHNPRFYRIVKYQFSLWL